MPEVDDKLIKDALKGDQKAFKGLVTRHRGSVFHIVFRIVRDKEIANDLVQETFMKAFSSLKSYRSEYRFSTWLYKIAANSSIDHLRKKRIQALSLDNPIKTEDGEVSETAYPPGYQYVGNPKYGRWQTGHSGESFWSFYGKYAMLSSLFNLGMGGRTVYRGDWDDYRRYSSQGRPYYGRNREYGTNGSFTRQTKPNFYQRKMTRQTRSNESFRNKVDRRVGRSRTGYRSRAGGYGK